MAMSDCIKCWDTPCTCGFEYRNLTREQRIEKAAIILGVRPQYLVTLNIPDQHPSFDGTYGWDGRQPIPSKA